MILISPYSKPMRNGTNSPKNYPYWPEVVSALNGDEVVQIGAGDEKPLAVGKSSFKFIKNLPLARIEDLVRQCRVWVSVDNFLPHLAHHVGKPGIVLWGQSDPNVFGYPENANLLKDRKYLRGDQFMIWEACEYKAEVFVVPEVVINAIRSV
jgi:ADP-heptose:LPS heptosyltransferase